MIKEDRERTPSKDEGNNIATPKRKIVIEFCDECPFEGTCDSWKRLTRKQRFLITSGVGIPSFMLKDCHLEDD